MLFATSVGALESLEFATACNNYNNNKQSGREVKRGAELLCHRPHGMKPESSTSNRNERDIPGHQWRGHHGSEQHPELGVAVRYKLSHLTHVCGTALVTPEDE